MSVENPKQPTGPQSELVFHIGQLAQPLAPIRVIEIMDRADFRKKIEKVTTDPVKREKRTERATPADIVRDLLVELGVVGSRPYSQAAIADLERYIAEQDAVLSHLRDTDSTEWGHALLDAEEHVSGDSGIVTAFAYYRQAQIEHWGDTYDWRGYGELINQAESLATYVVAQAVQHGMV